MATSLSDVLSGKDEAPAAEAPIEKDETPAAEPAEASEPTVERVTSRRAEHRKKEFAAQGRDPSGKFLPKEEPKAAEAKAEPSAAPAKTEPTKAEPAKAEPAATPPAQPDMTPRERAAFAKAADETRKRQAAEQELARLRGAQPTDPNAQPKQFWDDPEGRLKAHEQQMGEIAVRTKLQTAEAIARSKYTDFDEKVAIFSETLEQAPDGAKQALIAKWMGAADPAQFAYDMGKHTKELREAGGLDKLIAEREAKARAEERKKVEDEYKAKQAELEKQRAALPGTLSDVKGGAASSAAPVWGGPTPLSEIVKH